MTFQLASGEAHVWSAALDVPPEASARLYATLSSDERQRSARLRFERDRQRFIVAHGTLRELLGRYLDVKPGRLRYTCNAFGKPGLSLEFGERLTFNLSHSGGRALIALAAGSRVGVDLEWIRAESGYADIARSFYSAAEVERLDALPSALYAEAFLTCWTKKEAYVKARGEGLAAITAELAPAGGWSFHTLRPAPGYIGALALEGTGLALKQFRI